MDLCGIVDGFCLALGLHILRFSVVVVIYRCICCERGRGTFSFFFSFSSIFLSIYPSGLYVCM